MISGGLLKPNVRSQQRQAKKTTRVTLSNQDNNQLKNSRTINGGTKTIESLISLQIFRSQPLY